MCVCVSWCFGDSVFQVPSSEGIPSQQHHEILAHAPIPQLGSTTWATPAKDIKRLARERERERFAKAQKKKSFGYWRDLCKILCGNVSQCTETYSFEWHLLGIDMCPQIPFPRYSNSCGDDFPDPNQRLHVRPQFLPHFGASWPSSSRVAEGHTGPCGWNGILWCHRWLMLTGLGWLGNGVPNFWRISADQCGVPCWATVAAQKCNRHSYSSPHNKLNGHNSDAIRQWWGLAMEGYVYSIRSLISTFGVQD